MLDIAKIVVDIPVADLNKAYDYQIPSQLKEKIKIGHAVLVPFGRRKVIGFVVGFAKVAEVPLAQIKPIIKMVREESFFDEQALKLFKWIAAYYKSYLVTVIKTAVPTGVISGKVKKKKRKYLCLNQGLSASKVILEELKKSSPKQGKALEILIKAGEKYTVQNLARQAGVSASTVKRLVDKGYLSYQEDVLKRKPVMLQNPSLVKALKPTVQQSKAIQQLVQATAYNVFLLHGVTGSGKTEIYLQTIAAKLKEGEGAIVLVPEISLTPMMVERFYSRFGEKVAVLHSNLSLGERYDEWRRIKEGEAKIVIGARSAIFAPVDKLGLIIVDEEHESSYKQSENPAYHARDVAIKRAKIHDIPVVLGSATPSLETYYWAKKGVFHYIQLSRRIKQEKMPAVEIVDLREELKEGNVSIFSRSLHQGLQETLLKGKQALLFLNRRGYANYAFCRECGRVIRCPHCDISLTYHAQNNSLLCHYCGYHLEMPRKCPECGSNYLKAIGIGTERIEAEIKKLFPQAKVGRMDVDTTARKGAHQKILGSFARGEIDILIGTQMIAKGHDYPNVLLVGVILADTTLNLPDFRAPERTFQLLTQVAGRTGRGEEEGKVIIQTYTPEHYSIQAASKHDYEIFFQQEIKYRKALSYPPFTQLVNIIVQGYDEAKVGKAAGELVIFLGQYKQLIEDILGPAPAPLSKLRNRFRWQIILKFKGWEKRNLVLNRISRDFLPGRAKEIVYNIDVDPLQML